MNKELNHHYKDYLQYLTLQGKSVKHVKYGLKIFMTYLQEYGLDYQYIKINDGEDFQRYLSTQTGKDGRVRLTRSSVLNVVGCIFNFYEYLTTVKAVYGNPFRDIDRVKRNKALPRNILNEKNMNILLNHMKDFNRGKDIPERKTLYRGHVLCELLYSTGIRVHEAASLTVGDIDFYRGVVTVTDRKNGTTREVILNSYAEKVLSIYIHEMRDYILLKRGDIDETLLFGAKYVVAWLNGMLNRESKALKLGPCTSHNFRHAVGYHLLRGGCDIRYIQDILGHRALHSTQIYTKVEKEDLKDVIDRFHPRVLHSQTSGEDNENL